MARMHKEVASLIDLQKEQTTRLEAKERLGSARSSACASARGDAVMAANDSLLREVQTLASQDRACQQAMLDEVKALLTTLPQLLQAAVANLGLLREDSEAPKQRLDELTATLLSSIAEMLAATSAQSSSSLTDSGQYEAMISSQLASFMSALISALSDGFSTSKRELEESLQSKLSASQQTNEEVLLQLQQLPSRDSGEEVRSSLTILSTDCKQHSMQLLEALLLLKEVKTMLQGSPSTASSPIRKPALASVGLLSQHEASTSVCESADHNESNMADTNHTDQVQQNPFLATGTISQGAGTLQPGEATTRREVAAEDMEDDSFGASDNVDLPI